MRGSFPGDSMLISRTPVRVSFCGGGTDVDEFAVSHPFGGRVASMALDRFVYVTINPRFDDMIRISYSEMEFVASIDEIKHDLVREALKLTGIHSGVEITTIADIPGRGTGLGSSSSVTIGLLNAMHTFAGRNPTKKQLAEEACRIEIETLGAPIGRQDQYAAAFGGINSISFSKSGTSVEPLSVGKDTIQRLKNEFSLVFTGQTRSASEVLGEPPKSASDKTERLLTIREQANFAVDMLERGDLEGLGELLNEAWKLKRGVSSSITNPAIDSLYDRVMELGANGAKLLGAGSGGFLLVHGGGDLRAKMSAELGNENRIIPLGLDMEGSVIIHGRSK